MVRVSFVFHPMGPGSLGSLESLETLNGYFETTSFPIPDGGHKAAQRKSFLGGHVSVVDVCQPTYLTANFANEN